MTEGKKDTISIIVVVVVVIIMIISCLYLFGTNVILNCIMYIYMAITHSIHSFILFF